MIICIVYRDTPADYKGYLCVLLCWMVGLYTKHLTLYSQPRLKIIKKTRFYDNYYHFLVTYRVSDKIVLPVGYYQQDQRFSAKMWSERKIQIQSMFI